MAVYCAGVGEDVLAWLFLFRWDLLRMCVDSDFGLGGYYNVWISFKSYYGSSGDERYRPNYRPAKGSDKHAEFENRGNARWA